VTSHTLDFRGGGREAGRGEKIAHPPLVGGDLLLHADQIVAGGDEAQRPQRQIGALLSLGNALDGDDADGLTPGDEPVADLPATDRDAERHHCGGGNGNVRGPNGHRRASHGKSTVNRI
jgi:hypothetical protein